MNSIYHGSPIAYIFEWMPPIAQLFPLALVVWIILNCLNKFESSSIWIQAEDHL